MRILKLYSPTCQPCKLVDAFLKKNEVKFESVDVFERPEVASQFGVQAVPVTLLLDDNGHEVVRVTGHKPNELLKLIKTSRF
jgi:thioredoxin 1